MKYTVGSLVNIRRIIDERFICVDAEDVMPGYIYGTAPFPWGKEKEDEAAP